MAAQENFLAVLANLPYAQMTQAGFVSVAVILVAWVIFGGTGNRMVNIWNGGDIRQGDGIRDKTPTTSSPLVPKE